MITDAEMIELEKEFTFIYDESVEKMLLIMISEHFYNASPELLNLIWDDLRQYMWKRYLKLYELKRDADFDKC